MLSGSTLTPNPLARNMRRDAQEGSADHNFTMCKFLLLGYNGALPPAPWLSSAPNLWNFFVVILVASPLVKGQ